MVAQQIGRRIVSGDYPPGETLPTEPRIQAEFGVSRTAVREAIRQLAAKGLIVSRPKVGTRVRPRIDWSMLDSDILRWHVEQKPTDEFIEALFDMREIIEPAAAERAAERASEEDIERIRIAMAGIEANERGSPEQVDADVVFHMSILEAARNPIVRSLGALIELALEISFSLSWRVAMQADAVYQHRLVFEAVRDGRAEEAFLAMRKLLRNSRGDVIDAIWSKRKGPELLDGRHRFDRSFILSPKTGTRTVRGETHMRLMQVRGGRGGRRVVASEGGESWFVDGYDTVYDLALAAIAKRRTLAAMVEKTGRAGKADPAALLASGRVVSPIDHPDPAHLIVTGTGLTHLGSAATRDSMHQKAKESDEETLTDSMKIFRMGLEGGKPKPGKVGVQPEWFYKGDGSFVAAPGAPLVSPSFAGDGGEEPEVAGIYVVSKAGVPYRVGFALLNEFSDHVTERQNYLWLAHSKLRPCAFGPELLLGDLPDDVRGTSRIRRGRKVIFDQPFLTGEANMSHSIANLEAHHFKYPYFRRPGDIHVHAFGTATLSFAAGIKTRAGDVFEIEAPEFGLPLVNPLAIGKDDTVGIRAL